MQQGEAPVIRGAFPQTLVSRSFAVLDCVIAGGRLVPDGRLISLLADGLAGGRLAALGPAPDCRDLLELLARVSDGRPGRGRDHPVAAVLALAAAAVVAGSRSFTAIAGWAADVPAGVLEDLYRRCGAAPPGARPPAKTPIWRGGTRARGPAFERATRSRLEARAPAARNPPLPGHRGGGRHARPARGHGRIEPRTIQVTDAPGDLPFPHVSQAYLIERHVTALNGQPCPTSPRSASPAWTPPAQALRPSPISSAANGPSSPCTGSVLQGSPSLSYDVAPGARRRASATHLRGCRARCRCCSDARRLGTGRLVQHLWRDYPVLINRRPDETRKTHRMSGFAPPGKLRDTLYREDNSSIRTRSGPRAMATLRNLAVGALNLAGRHDTTEATRWASRHMDRPFTVLGLTS